MAQYRKLLQAIAFIAGLNFLAFGALALFVAVSGGVVRGQSGVYIAGASCLAIAAPLLALPFSSRLAAWLTYLVLAAFALFALWAAFGSSLAPPLSFRFASLAFTVLFLVRVGLALRRRDSGMGT